MTRARQVKLRARLDLTSTGPGSNRSENKTSHLSMAITCKIQDKRFHYVRCSRQIQTNLRHSVKCRT